MHTEDTQGTCFLWQVVLNHVFRGLKCGVGAADLMATNAAYLFCCSAQWMCPAADVYIAARVINGRLLQTRVISYACNAGCRRHFPLMSSGAIRSPFLIANGRVFFSFSSGHITAAHSSSPLPTTCSSQTSATNHNLVHHMHSHDQLRGWTSVSPRG